MIFFHPFGKHRHLTAHRIQFSCQQVSQEVCVCLSFELGRRAQIMEH